MDPITTDQLLAFDQIARDGTFSRAAQSLDIAQPTISARVLSLEETVGGPLFLRGGRTVSLTPLGHSFLPYARRALILLREGLESARLVREGQVGRVAVGAIESLTGSFLASSIAHFVATHPHVELFVRSAHSQQIVEMLQDGLVQLGLLAWPVFTVDLVMLLRFDEPLLVVVAPQHPLAHGGPYALEVVAARGAPLLHVRWGPTAEPFLDQLTRLATPVRDVPIDTAQQMALAGRGVALLTRTLVADDLTAGRLVALDLADTTLPTRQSALVRLPQTRLDEPSAAFVRVLRESATRVGILAG